MRDRAAEIAAGTTADVGDVTARHLPDGLLPGRFVPGLADWVMPRRTRIEDTSGTKESLVLPYGEEPLRCARTARARNKLSRKGC
ncbi:hypothetical protein [Streptomyces griseorubiginosus]|uniref:hypothetical protein n=1 Tax=Streptomyces griseorubiginosus TaxID=67304 RepID=UPI00364C325A